MRLEANQRCGCGLPLRIQPIPRRTLLCCDVDGPCHAAKPRRSVHGPVDLHDAAVDPRPIGRGAGIGIARARRRGLRIAVLRGWFEEHASDEAREALAEAAARIGVTQTVELEHTQAARAAMNLIVISEAGASVLPLLRQRPRDFDPMTRGRLLAGAMLPAAHIAAAQRFRAWYRREVEEVFRKVDVLLAPALPFPAIRIGQDSITFRGRAVAPRPMYTMLTAPLSFIGLPIISMPIERPAGLPLGIQVVTRPFAEAMAFRVAAALTEPSS